MHHASQLSARVPRLLSVVVGDMAREVASDDFTRPASGVQYSVGVAGAAGSVRSNGSVHTRGANALLSAL